MFWIINDKIKFCPERNLLISLTRPDLNVILTTPASRCLNLLLESFPEVVTQKYFFDKVWGEDGMLVPANTLYQNISIIRRGLRTTGETDDTLVATVPRKGFQIEKNVRVTRVDTDCVDDGKKATATGVETSPVEKKDKPVENIPVMPGGRKKQRQLRQYIFSTALMIIAFLPVSLRFNTFYMITRKKIFSGIIQLLLHRTAVIFPRKTMIFVASATSGDL